MLRKAATASVAIVVTLITVFLAPTPAQAGNGDVSSTATVSSMSFSAGGVVRSELRNATITFWKNTLDGSYWITVTAQIRDRSTDGWCAKARYSSGWATPWGYECNAVWKTFSATLADAPCTCGHSLDLYLGRGSSSGTTFADSYTFRRVNAPSGW